MAEQTKKGLLKEVFEWLEAIVFSLSIVVLIFTFLFRVVGVDGSSMFPTLHHKDRVIITGLFWKPAQGDIVVVTQPNPMNEPLIKRIIALEGQTVEFDFSQGLIKVDGVELQESYIADKTTFQGDLKEQDTVVVEKDHVFVMGDNRNNSKDSRDDDIGQIHTRYLLGKAVFRIFPFTGFGIIKYDDLSFAK